MDFKQYLETVRSQTAFTKTRAMITELLNNSRIPINQDDGAAICSAIRREYPDNEELQALGL